ncbi:hypothetical protein BJY00DRAFT_186671 [Aspergillus carlsbadensis]|nr:hypothetical protein BJY00DRAFT_186671 [Aspergillus carlsbadensis]
MCRSHDSSLAVSLVRSVVFFSWSGAVLQNQRLVPLKVLGCLADPRSKEIGSVNELALKHETSNLDFLTGIATRSFPVAPGAPMPKRGRRYSADPGIRDESGVARLSRLGEEH